MRKHLLFIITVISVGSITLTTSCKDDEPAPPHIVGEWNLIQLAYTNLPSAYYYYQDPITWTATEFGYSTYLISVKADGTYSRNITRDGGSFEDNGRWEVSDDTFILNSNSIGESNDYEIEKNIDGVLWLGASTIYPLIKPAVFEAHEDINAYLNSLWEDEVLSNQEYIDTYDEVTLNLTLVFEKQ